MVDSTGAETLSSSELRDIYQPMRSQDARIADIVRILDSIIDRDTEEDLTIEEVETSITSLRDLIVANTREILYLHNLIGLLVFELLEQGIEIKDKKLLNEIKLYLKY